jgi:hypothetical protein
MYFYIDTIIDSNVSTELCEIMGKCKSDKGNKNITESKHNYTTFYFNIFKNIRYDNLKIFELGIGTNNLDISSNMGIDGTPGASLYGWSEFFPNSYIYGGDIDKRILFQNDRIKTYFCDQTNKNTIKEMWDSIDENFNIIIEDGLHDFEANVCFFENSIHKLSKNGYFIIEDIKHCDIFLFNNIIEKWKFKYDHLLFYFLKIPSKVNFKDNNMLVVNYK